MKKIKINWKIFILVIEIFVISILLFMFFTKDSTVKEFYLENSRTDKTIIVDSTLYKNTVMFSNQILKENVFLSSDNKRINIDTLISQSSKFFIFFSQNDCDYCVHELIYIATRYIKKDDAIITPLCSNVKMLQFSNKNYFTEFDFLTTCPNDVTWKDKVHTPFIAFVSQENFSVSNILAYEANDTIQLKKFIRKNIKE